MTNNTETLSEYAQTQKEEAHREEEETHREEEPKCEKYMKEISKAVNKVSILIEDYHRSQEKELNEDDIKNECLVNQFDDHYPKDQCEEIEIDQPECDDELREKNW